MDFDDLDAPQFVDFDLLRQGQESGMGDEWFDKQVENIGGTPVLVQPDENFKGNVIKGSSPVVAMATEEALAKSSVAMVTGEEEEEQSVKPPLPPSDSEILKKLFQKNKSQKKTSGRIAALKATESIHTMYKPQKLSSSKDITSNMTKKTIKSTEQIELERIEEIRRQAAKNKALSRRSFRAFKSKKNKQRLTKSSKPPTEAAEFNFKTDQRLKSKGTPTASGSSELKFPMNLRSFDTPEYIPNDPSERGRSCTPKEPTKVQPFEFQTDKRLRTNIDQSNQEKYVSSAEFAENFEKKTPPRFRTKPQRPESNEKELNYSTRVTIAKSPNLTSRHRTHSGGERILSTTEREEKELEEIRKHPFKARPVNPRIFTCMGTLGVPTAYSFNSKPKTVPVSPSLVTKERFGNKRPHPESDETEKEEKQFKANPVPKNIFDKVTGVPEKQPSDITVPLSPRITKKRRIEKEEDEKVEIPSINKPLPLPDFSHVFQPTLTKKHTGIEPFSFDSKYFSKDELIQQLVKKKDEELAKKREFKATPLPTPVDPLPPVKSTLSTTEVKPFHLETDVRGEHYLEKFNEKLSEMEKERRKAIEFKATDSKTVHNPPALLPPKLKRPLTEINSFSLCSETRGLERAKFEEEKKLRESEKMAIEADRQALKEAEEVIEIKKLRRSLVHKAQPIHKYNPIHIQASTKAVTCPISPAFVSTGRTRGGGTSDGDNHGN